MKLFLLGYLVHWWIQANKLESSHVTAVCKKVGTLARQTNKNKATLD